jgi:CheY-like chemotaxis protein
VAKGVETGTQLAALPSLGCAWAQGYYWSAPLEGAEACQWIPARRSRTALEPGMAESVPAWRVLLVEDERRLRELFRLAVEDDGPLSVVGEPEDGREAVALARHLQPDAVLLDLAMPGIGGWEAFPPILAVAPGTKVVVLSGLDPESVEERAREAGAAGYLVKGAGPDPAGRRPGRHLGRRPLTAGRRPALLSGVHMSSGSSDSLVFAHSRQRVPALGGRVGRPAGRP